MQSKLNIIQKAISEPQWFISELSERTRTALFWDKYYQRLRDPKKDSTIPYKNEINLKILEDIRANNIDIEEYHIDINDYRAYLKQADYSRFFYYYGGGKGSNFPEKSLEHFVSARLLNLSEKDVYIDIANANSPTYEIYHEMFGTRTYIQDLIFEKGMNNDRIGGDAAELPIDDEFATKMGLHCSFEHFENDSDIRFMRNTAKKLKPGGQVCILPLYMHSEYSVLTDPATYSPDDINFEEDAVLYCSKKHNNRHSRFYDIIHLKERVIDNADGFDFKMYYVINEKDIDESCYLKFIALLTKK